MKRQFKKLAIAVALTSTMVVGFGSVAFAGGGHKGFGGHGGFERLESMSEQERLEFLENKLDKRVQRMTKQLDLTKDQQVKVRQVMADSQTQLLELYEKNKGVEDKSAARAEAKVIMQQSRQDVKDVLTAEQRTKLKEQRGKRGDRGKHGKKGKGKLGERLAAKLDLTDAQRPKVDAILKEAHGKLHALRDQDGEPAAKKAQAKAIMTGAADDIDALLDKTQQAQFAELREKMIARAGEARRKHKGERGEKRGKRGAF